MTRLWNDGAEFKDLLTPSSYQNLFIDTSIYRSGAAAYRIPASDCWFYYYVADKNELYIRFGFYFTTGGNGPFLKLTKDSTVLDSLYFDGTSHLIKAYLGDSVSLLSTGTHPAILSEWHVLEIHIKIDDDPNGIFNVYLDGVEDIDYTGDTKPGADTAINRVWFFGKNDQGGYDDIAINDTAGDVDNSWCGNGFIDSLGPDANGDVNDWMGNDGNKVDNYLLVDEVPHDSDTTYVTISGTGIQDMYNLSAFTDTNRIVSRIWVEARAKDVSAASAKIKLGIKTGGNVYLGSGITLASNYTRLVGEDYLINPVGSGIWNKTDLDAIQFVVESL